MRAHQVFPCFEPADEFNGNSNKTRRSKLTPLPGRLPKRLPDHPQNLKIHLRTLPIRKQMHHPRQPPLFFNSLVAFHRSRTPARHRSSRLSLFDEDPDKLKDSRDVFEGGDGMTGFKDGVGDCCSDGPAGGVGLAMEEGEVVWEGEDGEEVCVGGDWC